MTGKQNRKPLTILHTARQLTAVLPPRSGTKPAPPASQNLAPAGRIKIASSD